MPSQAEPRSSAGQKKHLTTSQSPDEAPSVTIKEDWPLGVWVGI